MSLNNIRLTPLQLTHLYPHALIETSETPFRPASGGLPVSFLGSNEKNILVLTSSAEAVFLSETELHFLTTVLSACHKTLADVAIVNWLNTEKNYEGIVDFFQSKLVFLFEVSPVDFGLPINFPPFQIQEFAGRTYLHAPALKKIEADKELKKKLWDALKKIFNIQA